MSNPKLPDLISNTTVIEDCDDIVKLNKDILILGCGFHGIGIYNISNLV
jgi:hypothetical protein